MEVFDVFIYLGRQSLSVLKGSRVSNSSGRVRAVVTEIVGLAGACVGQRPSSVNQLCGLDPKLPAGLLMPGIQLEYITLQTEPV